MRACVRTFLPSPLGSCANISNGSFVLEKTGVELDSMQRVYLIFRSMTANHNDQSVLTHVFL